VRSALYEGRVYHDRLTPRRHRFQARVFLPLVDLGELERGELPIPTRWSPLAWFRRADYMGDPERCLREVVLDRVEAELGRRPEGPVALVGHLRSWLYVFNPVVFYYCYDREERLDAIVAEITNTPWDERHAYVLDARDSGPGAGHRWRFAKDFHVSPFHPMEHEYDWSFRTPGEHLTVHMENLEAGAKVFQAGLTAERRPLTRGSLVRALLRHPLLTWRVTAGIYVHAALLWLKRVPFHVHPSKRGASRPASAVRT